MEFNRPTVKTADGRVITYRSNWEANYGFYLDWLVKQREIASWQYEPMPRYYFFAQDGHPLGNGYLPDFKVFRNDGSFYLVEIKGKSQGMLKLKRMAKHYPEIKVELVDAEAYKALKRQVGKMLNFY